MSAKTLPADHYLAQLLQEYRAIRRVAKMLR